MLLMVGDHVWRNLGGCVALVVEIRFDDATFEQKALVKIQFLGLVPHFIADSVLNNSIKYYCPKKS